VWERWRGGPQGELVRVGQIGRCKRWNDDRVGCMQQLVQHWCCCHALIADAILNQLSPCVTSLRAASILLFSPLLLLFCSFFYYYFLYDLFHAAISLLWQLHSTSPISFLCPRLWHLYPLLSITELGILLFPLPNTMQKTKLVIIVVKAISKQLIFSSFPGQ